MSKESSDISLTLRLFARYREALGFDECKLSVPSELRTIRQLVDWLAGQRPDWLEVLQAPDKLVALNKEIVSQDTDFNVGDELALLPPVTGG